MTQANPIIGANKTGLDYRSDDNDGKQAIMNHHKGATAPSYAEAGMLWLDDISTPWDMKFYDGSDWISVFTIDISGNVILSNKIDFGLAEIDGNTGNITMNSLSINRDFIFKAGGTEITRLKGDDGWSLIKVNGGSDLEFYEIVTFVWNPGSIPANSQVTTSVAVAGCTDSGMTVSINNNAHINGLVEHANISVNGTVDLYLSNVTNGAISGGNRTYTLIIQGA